MLIACAAANTALVHITETPAIETPENALGVNEVMVGALTLRISKLIRWARQNPDEVETARAEAARRLEAENATKARRWRQARRHLTIGAVREVTGKLMSLESETLFAIGADGSGPPLSPGSVI
jgi:ABC-type nitrate/sulfonate/bicarbonate transport system substrate-binding protein